MGIFNISKDKKQNGINNSSQQKQRKIAFKGKTFSEPYVTFDDTNELIKISSIPLTNIYLSYQEVKGFEVADNKGSSIKTDFSSALLIGIFAKKKVMVSDLHITIYTSNPKYSLIMVKLIDKETESDSLAYKGALMQAERISMKLNYIINNKDAVSDKTINQDPIKQVKGLKELLDIGAITQSEFDLKKKELLDL